LPSQIVVDALAYGMRYNRASEDLKCYGSGDQLLAGTSEGYGRIYDHEVVAAVQQVAGNGRGSHRWKIPGVMNWSNHTYNPEAPVTLDSTTLYASDCDVFMFLVDDRNPVQVGLLKDGSPDLMFRGFYVSNSEVGARLLRLAAFYLRGVCMNRNLWGVEGFQEIEMRHTKYAPTRFIEEIRPALESYAEGSSKLLVEGVAKAKEAVVAETQEKAIEFLNERGLSRKRAMAILETGEKEEGHPVRTVWDFSQAITANAREVPNTDVRLDLERIAGKLLDKVA
jgi:hypothetical protein